MTTPAVSGSSVLSLQSIPSILIPITLKKKKKKDHQVSERIHPQSLHELEWKEESVSELDDR